MYGRGAFHLGRQILAPAHGHFQSGQAYSLWQAGSSVASGSAEDENAKRRGMGHHPLTATTGHTHAPAKAIPPTPWHPARVGQRLPHGGHVAPGAQGHAFPALLSSPAPPPRTAAGSSADPLANLGLDMLRGIRAAHDQSTKAVDSFDPFGEDAADMPLVAALSGAAGAFHPEHGHATRFLAVDMDASRRHSEPMPIFAPEVDTAPRRASHPVSPSRQAQVAPKLPRGKDYGALIKQLGKEGGWERVRGVWEEMERGGVVPDLATRNAYLEHLGRHPSRLPLARRFFLSLPLAHRNLATYNVMVKMHSVALQPELAEQYFLAISSEGGVARTPSGGWAVTPLEPNVVSRTHLLDAYARAGRLPPALAVFREIDTSRPPATPEQLRVAYKHLLVAHVNGGDVPGAMRHFRRMRERGIPADPFSYALAARHAPTLAEARDALASYPGRPDARMLEAGFLAHARAGEWDGAWAWFARALRERPGARIWSALARGVFGDAQHREADEFDGDLLEGMEGEGELTDRLGVLDALGMSAPAQSGPSREEAEKAIAAAVVGMERAGITRGDRERAREELTRRWSRR
ncbi:hypothetical protein DFJ74DRAFT_661728 [Hyaloraphidium curvatum]|nr:hypothetical protein DFJ74DRAFT_661728 [Hyaloraphidium curvatum]